MNIQSVSIIARNEIFKILNNPLTLIVIVTMLGMIVLNSAACGYKLTMYEENLQGIGDVFLTIGISTIIFNISLLLTILSLFIGLSSIADERSRGRLKLLISKPVYKKEILMGKIFGVSVLIMSLIIISVLLSVFSISVMFRLPVSLEDTMLRLCSMIIIIFLNCMFSFGLMLLIGIIFINYYHALICCVTYLYVTWFINWPSQLHLISSWLPSSIFFKITDPQPGKMYLLDTTVSFSRWLEAAFPYSILLLLGIIAIILCGQAIFSSRDE